jgi:pilus assembly protein Flp/PilA
MSKLIRKLMKDESGASLVEYVLLVALIGVVAIAAMQLVGGQAQATLNNAGTTLQGANAG